MLRWVGLILILAGSKAMATAAPCGLYQVEDFGDRTIYSLIDFSTYPPVAVNYMIVNPHSNIVQSMVAGRCYCVSGESTPTDPDTGDMSYQNLSIEQVTKGPFSKCEPAR